MSMRRTGFKVVIKRKQPLGVVCKKGVLRFVFAWKLEVFWKENTTSAEKNSFSAESRITPAKFCILLKIRLFSWDIEVF